MGREWRVRLLRQWFSLRERLGFPRRMTAEEFDRATDTTLLAGSPWVWINSSPTHSGGTTKFAVTNATWPIRAGRNGIAEDAE